MTCVSVCPAEGALALTVVRRRLQPAVMFAGIAVIFLGLYGYAEWSGHWDANVGQGAYLELIPRARFPGGDTLRGLNARLLLG